MPQKLLNPGHDLAGRCAKTEDASPEALRAGILKGHVVIPKNNKHAVDRPCAIGTGMTTKVNANIGLSQGNSDIDTELLKMGVAVKAGTDTLMDLSTGSGVKKVLKKLLAECPVPLGTVPIYELACEKRTTFNTLKADDFLEVLERQATEGVDFFTIHAGITLDAVRFANEKRPRILSIVSRGGALLASWMLANNKENPFLVNFDRVLAILKKYDVTLSLGDSLRPGSIMDASDELQIGELHMLGKLQKIAYTEGVQTIIEGPGHMPLDQIEANMKLEKTVCNGAPFYVLGPLVTDAAPGYDHIVGAIGGAIAAWHGADFLCYVTPAEHVKLPDVEDVRMGVIASKIAAHAADIVKKHPSAIKRDTEISKARANRDWGKQFALALDPETPEIMRKRSMPSQKDVCTMCGDLCSIKITEESFSPQEAKKKGSR